MNKYIGILVYWIGILLYWIIGVLVSWPVCIGYIGRLVNWAIGTSVYWCIRVLVFEYIGILE